MSIKTLALWICTATVALALNSLFLFAQYRVFSPAGDSELLVCIMILGLPLSLALLALIVSVFGLLRKKWRKDALRIIPHALIYVVIALACMTASAVVRRNALRDLAERSMPLVHAIDAFEKTHGRPPENLEQLVPEFLSAVPETGLGVSPKYLYAANTPKAGETARHGFHGNPWLLCVPVPDLLTEWRGIAYWPHQNYADHPGGTRFGKAGDWLVVDGLEEAPFAQKPKPN